MLSPNDSHFFFSFSLIIRVFLFLLSGFFFYGIGLKAKKFSEEVSKSPRNHDNDDMLWSNAIVQSFEARNLSLEKDCDE